MNAKTPAQAPAFLASIDVRDADRLRHSVLEVLAQALQRLQLRDALGQLALRLGDFHRFGPGLARMRSASSLAARTAASSMSCARTAVSASTVTTCGCTSRMPPEIAKSSCFAARQGHHDLARLEARDQRRVPRRDAELADLAGGDHQRRLRRGRSRASALTMSQRMVCHMLHAYSLSRMREQGEGVGPRKFGLSPCALRALPSPASGRGANVRRRSSWPSRPLPRCRRPCRTPAPAGGRTRRRRSS